MFVVNPFKFPAVKYHSCNTINHYCTCRLGTLYTEGFTMYYTFYGSPIHSYTFKRSTAFSKRFQMAHRVSITIFMFLTKYSTENGDCGKPSKIVIILRSIITSGQMKFVHVTVVEIARLSS